MKDPILCRTLFFFFFAWKSGQRCTDWMSGLDGRSLGLRSSVTSGVYSEWIALGVQTRKSVDVKVWTCFHLTRSLVITWLTLMLLTSRQNDRSDAKPSPLGFLSSQITFFNTTGPSYCIIDCTLWIDPMLTWVYVSKCLWVHAGWVTRRIPVVKPMSVIKQDKLPCFFFPPLFS